MWEWNFALLHFSGNDDANLTKMEQNILYEFGLDKFSRQNYDDINNLNIVNPMGVPLKFRSLPILKKTIRPHY